MYKPSSFFSNVVRDIPFEQTQFANTAMSSSICFVGREQFLLQANENPNITVVIVPESLSDLVAPDKGLIISETPEETFYRLHNQLFIKHGMVPEMTFGLADDVDMHHTAIISELSWIGSGVHIGAGVIIEDYCYIGDNVRIESGAIIGSSGHYYKQYNDKLFRVEHAGGVWLEQGVQVLAGAVVSKSLHPDFTRVGEDSVVSIQSHVGHGCKIGKRCTLTGNVQVSGFTTIGDDVWVGPSATIGNLLTIGDYARIETGSVVIKNVADSERVSGNYARSHRANIRDYTKKLRGK